MAGKIVLLGLALGLAATLSGCVLAPGSNLTLGTQALPDDAKVDLDNKLNVQAITPDLVSHLRAPPVRPGPNPELDKSLHAYEYLVGSGDVLSVTVWDHPELMNPGTARAAAVATSSGGAGTNTSAGGSAATASQPFIGYPVDSDGTVYFPYVGTVKVSGLRIREIRNLLRDKLSRFIPDPQLDVSVAAFRAQRVYVTGEVKYPGTVPLTNVPVTLLDAVNQSGGFLTSANWANVTLTRQGQELHYSMRDLYQWGDINQNILLQANDVVFVPPRESNKVFVLGEIRQQMSVPMTLNGLTLAEALTSAGGINEVTANAAGVFVLRHSPEGSGKLIDVYQLNIKQATAMVLADGFPLQERDIIYVKAAPLARWNRVINLLLPSLDFLYLNTQVRYNNLKAQ